MDDLDTIRRMIVNWGMVDGQKVNDCPQAARFITGKMITDAQYHYFEQASGIRLDVVEDPRPWRTIDGHIITGYEIIDEKKYMWFKLRWS